MPKMPELVDSQKCYIIEGYGTFSIKAGTNILIKSKKGITVQIFWSLESVVEASKRLPGEIDDNVRLLQQCTNLSKDF